MVAEKSAASILADVEALLPEIAARRPETAAGRRLPADLVAALKRAGAFRVPMPREWGGPEMSMPDQLRMFERLSYADPAVGWCVMIGCDAGFYSSFLDDAAGRELWPDLDMVTAGWVAPGGGARRVDGGFVVDGQWSLGSGVNHADVIIGGCMVLDEGGVLEIGQDGSPAMRIVAAPADRFEILDTWHTTGLAGSGSNDYRCAGLFVPERHTFSFGDPVRRSGALYRFPGAFTTKFHGTVLGLGRRALDEVRAVGEHKVVVPQMVPMGQLPRVQSQLADAEAELRAARAYSWHAVETMWDALVAGRPLTDEVRIDMILSRVQATRAARQVALQAVQLVGTQAVYTSSILDQLVRDAVTIAQHVSVGPMAMENAGALMFGIQPTGPMAAVV